MGQTLRGIRQQIGHDMEMFSAHKLRMIRSIDVLFLVIWNLLLNKQTHACDLRRLLLCMELITANAILTHNWRFEVMVTLSIPNLLTRLHIEYMYIFLYLRYIQSQEYYSDFVCFG